MSLIREALKKADDQKEPAPTLLPDKEGKKEKPKTFHFIKYGAFIFLFLGLVGAVIYFYLPSGTSPKKTNLPSTRPGIVKQGEKKTQEPVLALRKNSISPINPPKVESKSLQPAPGRESGEKEKAQESERFIKGLPPRLFSPRPTAKNAPRPSVVTQLVTKAKLPNKVQEPAPIQATPEGMDSLPLVRLFNEAVSNQQKGLYSLAIQGYQEVLTFRPNHWETYNNLGLIYQNQKQYAKSLEMFQKTLSLNPRYLKGYNNLGLLYLNLGKVEEAVDQFIKAMELDPQFIPTYINLAVAYNRQGQVDQARKCLQKVLENDPENIEAHYNLGLLLENEGMNNKATEHYQKFVSKAQGKYSDLADELRNRWPGLK
jgi:Tfp pilus assembly protein PilF